MILDPAGIVVSIDPVGTTAFAIIKKSTSKAIIIAETITLTQLNTSAFMEAFFSSDINFLVSSLYKSSFI